MKESILVKICQLSSFFLAVAGCTSKTEIYSGEYRGQKVVLWTITQKSIFNNYYWPRLQLGSLPSIDLDDNATNNGVPYDTALYSAIPHYFIGRPNSAYNNNYDTTQPVPVIAYLSPAVYSADAFEKYASFFRDEWQTIGKHVTLTQGYRTITIAGVAYGSDNNLEHVFYSEDNNKKANLTIETNGAIYYNTDGAVQTINLSRRVQMPGRCIYLKKGGAFTLENLKTYKDAQGKTLLDYFKVLPEPPHNEPDSATSNN